MYNSRSRIRPERNDGNARAVIWWAVSTRCSWIIWMIHRSRGVSRQARIPWWSAEFPAREFGRVALWPRRERCRVGFEITM
jgi:hypothetical protein